MSPVCSVQKTTCLSLTGNWNHWAQCHGLCEKSKHLVRTVLSALYQEMKRSLCDKSPCLQWHHQHSIRATERESQRVGSQPPSPRCCSSGGPGSGRVLLSEWTPHLSSFTEHWGISPGNTSRSQRDQLLLSPAKHPRFCTLRLFGKLNSEPAGCFRVSVRGLVLRDSRHF